MVESVLAAEHYYFSSSYDLSHTMQRLYNTSPDFISMPLHERVRIKAIVLHVLLRFMYNRELNHLRINYRLEKQHFSIVCISGSISLII